MATNSDQKTKPEFVIAAAKAGRWTPADCAKILVMSMGYEQAAAERLISEALAG